VSNAVTNTQTRHEREDNKSGALERLRSKWLSRTVHDMRGPLFAARGYAKLILRDPASVTVTQREYLSHIVDNVNRLASLVDSFCEFPTEADLDLDLVCLNDILAVAIEKTSRSETLRFDAKLPVAELWTYADGAKLGIAVHKLLTAVVDFSRASTRIALRAGQEDDEFVLRCEANAVASQSDTGTCDLPNLEHTRRILRLHGGAVTADANRDARLLVTLRLPLVGAVR
jgi:signal transduction histidine kinase